MNGDTMITRVRRLLKDVEDDVNKGEFWGIHEIVLALNVSQYIFINTCIENNLYYLINALHKGTNQTSGGNLPSDYLHYSSAHVTSDKRVARIHIGAEGALYRNVKHDAAIIVRNSFSFVSGGTSAQGVLYYYKKPAFIGASSNGLNTRSDFNTQNFDDYIYNNIIVTHAAVILSIKEIQTQRDFKRENRWIRNMMMQPVIGALYINNTDTPTGILRKIIHNEQAKTKNED